MNRQGRGSRRAAKLLGGFALLASFAFAGGCGRTGKDQALTLRRRLEGEPKTLNPILATSDPEAQVSALLQRNLLDYDEALNLVPGLAESVTPDADHLVYTVKLRADARWEDGTPITADDVVYTVTTLVDPKTPALNRRGFFDGFTGAEKVDERTARVRFSSAFANRLDAFNLPLLPAAAYRGTDVNANERNRRPLASGPFRLARWDSGRSLELVRNTQYFGPGAPAERVLFRVVPETAAAFQALKTEELDEMRLTAAQRDELVKAGDAAPARVVLWEDLTFSYLIWNNRSPLFSDARVRRALTLLVDREQLARTLYGGTARPANGPIPPGLWSHDPTLAPWPHDPAAAEAALDAAGWKKGADGIRKKGNDRLAFDMTFGAGSEIQRQILETTQQSFRKAGVEMRLQPIEWAAFSTRLDAGDYQAAAMAMNLDPNPDLTPSWHSAQAPPNGFNYAFYANPKADALMAELRATFDRPRAKALYGELQRLIHDDEPCTFLLTVRAKWAVNRRVEDVRSSPLGLYVFWPGASSWRPVRVKAAL